ncbi:Cox19-like CHCH family protein [Arachis hypogaea]|nr:Cox19-like CHCH family protein [Arachis hypogaea]
MDHQQLNPSGAKPVAAAAPPLHKSDADDDDENVKQLDECSALYLLMQDCVVRTNRNWKECQPEVQALKECFEKKKINKGNPVPHQENKLLHWLRSIGEVWPIPGTIRELFERWTGRYKRKQDQKKWLPGFFAVIWNIWVQRNARIFNNQETSVEIVIRKTVLSYNEWTESDLFGG